MGPLSWLESVGELVDLRTDRHLDVVGVVVQDVILDFVVRDEAQLAVRALAWFVGHDSMVGDAGRRR
jgi:hypothetical protein